MHIAHLAQELAAHLVLARPLVCFDLEATGLAAERDRIVQMATARVFPDGRVEAWASIVNPEQPIPAETTAVHGITDAMAASAPTFAQLAPTITAILAGCDLAGYNIDKFDRRPAMVGAPPTGELPYRNRNAISRIGSHAQPRSALADERADSTTVAVAPLPLSPLPTVAQPIVFAGEGNTATRDGVHVGIDVGGRSQKGFDLCVTEWVEGSLKSVHWERLPHATPLPPTAALRALIREGDLGAFARATVDSAATTAAALWLTLQPLGASGVHIDSPSAFSRNTLGHGRLCEKRSLTGVSFQSTPSIACGNEHGGDWGWLVYGMVAFAACVRRAQLTGEEWTSDLAWGTFAVPDSPGLIVRECFPTATISTLRSKNRRAGVGRALGHYAARPEVQVVPQYLKDGVSGVKRSGDPLYDRADALVAALGALPHVTPTFRESLTWVGQARRWSANPGEQLVEGSSTCVE